MALTIRHVQAWLRAAGCGLLALLSFAPAAQAAGNHPELEWHVIDTEHFRVYYYESVTRTATVLAREAEEIYPQLADRYGYDLPGPVRIIIDDTADPLNGAAYHDYTLLQYEGVAAVSEFRGVHDWLHDVLAHEMAHLFSLRTATMFGGLVPGIMVSGIDAPGGRSLQAAATLFLPNELTPRWFAEGIAQVESTGLGFDRWDSHRDMLLRAAVLEDGAFDIGEMGALTDKNYLEAEKVYNQGFSFLSYLNANFGDETARAVAAKAGEAFTWDFRMPLAAVLDQDPAAVFDEWKASRDELYGDWLATWADQLYEGSFVVERGFLTRQVAVSPDGSRLAFSGNPDSDYPTGELYVWDVSRATDKLIFSGAGAQPAWLPDGSGLIVASDQAENFSGYDFNDLYLVRVPGGKATRLTHDLRADDPGVSADGKWIVATVAHDGARNLTLWPFDGKKLGAARTLTRFRPGVEAVHPRFSPDGAQIVFSVNVGSSSDLWLARVTDATLAPLTQGLQDEIEPFFLDAGTVVYVSDDRRAFDLYALNVSDRTRQRLTTTLGGAFSPTAAAGTLYFALYHDGGFAVFQRPVTGSNLGNGTPVTVEATAGVELGVFAADMADLNEAVAAPVGSRPYRFDALPFKVYPEIVYAERSARMGATLAWGDVLSKHELELEVLLGENQDYHFSYKNHQLTPDLIVDLNHFERRNRVVRGLDVSKYDFSFDAGVAGAIWTYGSHWAASLTETLRRVDFGYPIDRELERGYEHAGELQYFTLAPNVDGDINPTDGRHATFRLGYNGVRVFSTTGSVLDGKYVNQRYWSWTGGYTEYVALPGESTLEAGVNAGFLTRQVSAFDQLFLGGRIFFLRQGEFQTDTSFPGYEEFAIAGEKLLMGSLAYRFPLWKGHAKAGPVAADSVYLQGFGDAGNVLPHDVPWKEFWRRGSVTCAPGVTSCNLVDAKLRGLLADAGAEVRVKTILFDESPWNSFVRTAYGFHEPKKSRRWRYYFGMGIGF